MLHRQQDHAVDIGQQSSIPQSAFTVSIMNDDYEVRAVSSPDSHDARGCRSPPASTPVIKLTDC